MRLLRIASVTFAFATVAAAQAPATQRPQNRVSLEQYLDWEDVQNPQLSPDGTQIIFTRRWIDKMNDKWESSVWLMNADGTHQRAAGAGFRRAVVARRQAHRVHREGRAERIADLRALDGRRRRDDADLAPHGRAVRPRVVARRQVDRVHDERAGARQLAHPDAHAAQGREVDRGAEGHRRGSTIAPIASATPTSAYRHIFVIPADGGTPRQITNGDWNHTGAALLRPTASGSRSRRCASPNAESAFRKSQIYAANVETGEIKQLTNRNGTNGSPQYSPDGKLIAFMSADSVDHSAWAETKLWVMNADGSNAHVVSGNLDRPISGVMWADDNSGVYFNVESEGSKNLYFASTAGQFRPVTSGKHVLTVVERRRRPDSPSALRSTPTKPNDIVTFTVPKTGTASTFTQLTAVNDDVLAGQGARADRRDLVHVEGRAEDPGLDREAAGLRRDEEVSADARDPRRPAVDVQRRVQLLAPGSRGERLRHALHESARQHGLRREVHERDQERVPGQGLRRPDGRRRHGDRPRLRRHEEPVRVRLLGRRRADGVDGRSHRSLRRRRRRSAR